MRRGAEPPWGWRSKDEEEESGACEGGREEPACQKASGLRPHSVQVAASRGFRGEREKAMPEFLQEGGAPA